MNDIVKSKIGGKVYSQQSAVDSKSPLELNCPDVN